MQYPAPTRRGALQFLGIMGAASLLPTFRLAAQEGPIRIGALVPLTGTGGVYGASMGLAIQLACEEVNATGGILGRRLEVITEDDATNPEVALRAARKLIDVDKVVMIIGTWSSAVTTAIAPRCWESGVALGTVSGADSITRLPHEGFIFRTQATSVIWAEKMAKHALGLGCKRIFFMAPQNPALQSQLDTMTPIIEAAGGTFQSLIYDDKKPNYRAEMDQALRFQPDGIFMGGYTPDTSVLIKDVYRGGFTGKRFAFGFALNQATVSTLPVEVTENLFTASPRALSENSALTAIAIRTGAEQPDHWTCQCYDLTSMAILAMALAGEASGRAIRDNMRKVSQDGDMIVHSAVEGLQKLATGATLDYEGVSGPCEFNEIGDVRQVPFQYQQCTDGTLTTISVD